jgi:hypothetical protein
LEASKFATNQHWTAGMLPETFARVPRIAFVRNPWELYVSFFEHWNEYGLDTGSSFDAFIDHMTSQGHTLSMWIKYASTEGVPISIGTYEQLRVDALRLLRERVEVPESLATALQISPPVNGARHGDYRSYYSKDSIERVVHADQEIIEKFRYEF